LQCVLEFQSDHAQWLNKGGGASGGIRPEVQALEAYQHTLFRYLKKQFFSINFGQNISKNVYF